MSHSSVSFSSSPPPADAELDVKALLAALKRHRALILLPVLVALAASFVAVNLIPPRYSAEARLLVENRETAFTRPVGEHQAPEAHPPDPEAIASQVQILYSRDLAREVIRDLKLAQVAEFDPLIEQRAPLNMILALTGLVRDVSQLSAEERALDAYYERVSAYAVDKSRVIEIRVVTKDPDLSAKIANTIAGRFIDFQARAKLDRDRQARAYVEKKVDELRRAVAEAENKVEAYRARFDLLTGTSNQTLGIQSMSDLNTQLSAVQAQRADAEARAKSIREALKNGRSLESAEVLNSPIFQRLAEQRATLKAEIAQLATTLLPGHPRMRELNAQLADNETQARLQAERIARGLESDARTAAERYAALKQVLDQQKRLNAARGDQEVELRGLEREAKAQRDLLESWLAMSREASARDSLEVRAADARIVSNAVANNTPSFPKKLPIILVVTLSTLVVMTMLVITRELLSGQAMAAQSAVPIEPRFGPVSATAPTVLRALAEASLAAQPAATPAPEPVPAAAPERSPKLDPAPTPAVSALVERLVRAPDGDVAKRVLVTGASLEDSQADLALEVGRALAGEGHKIVLIDAFLRGRGLTEATHLDAMPGLSDLLVGATGFGDIIHPDLSTKLHIVPTGLSAHSLTQAVFEGPRFATMLAALDAAYDRILVHMPSMIEADATASVAPLFDLVLLGSRGAVMEVVEATRHALLASGAPEVDVVADAAPAPTVPKGPTVRQAA